ncbi:putative bifunctional diguanylate cyclase/phosphodiesterase [Pseudonocardia sp. CA-107938]|uniref:putative bifunctional diguanylate cyclase/phosphodiesterase n=1 Tax=Pseudonocardia sp. CA-107938 TaxID=3240021 RepID=UPI003D8D0C74
MSPDVLLIAAAAAGMAPAAMVVVDEAGVRWHNAAAAQLVEPYGGHWSDGSTGAADVVTGLRGGPLCLRWAAPDGSVRWWRAEQRDVPGGRLVSLVDETDYDGGPVTEVPGTGTWDWDVVADRVRWSPELFGIIGLRADVGVDRRQLTELLHPDDAPLLRRTAIDAARTGEPWVRTIRMYRADRSALRTFEVHGEGRRGLAAQPVVRLVGTARDVTEMQTARREVAFLAGHDLQTGVASRQRLMAYLAESAAGPDRGAVVVIDVDHLGEVNELHGIAVGDEALRALASVLRREIGGGPLLGRIGGDRFAAVLPARGIAEAVAAADRLCAAVDRTPVPTGAGIIHVAVSAGVAEIVRDDVDASLEHAGIALDEAKRTGRNRAVGYSDELRRAAGGRSALLRRVAGALEDGSMQLAAQPIVDLRTHRTTRYELLLRLCDGLEPPLGPAEFLPPVEHTDLVHRLDRWVVGQAVRALATPRARESGLRLEANLSGRSLEDPDLGGWILDELRRNEVQPDRLGVEITETAAVTELAAARGLATRLVEAGVGFALDDFGAGFGSFAYLKHLRFTSVKVAGDFVAQVDQSDTDRALVGAVVALARQMGMVTVAEQVDRPELVGELRRLGVDHGQGFHLGRPAPLVELVGAGT